MSKHAPEPWKVIKSVPAEGVECYWIQDSFGNDIATVNGPQTAGREASARLIAAAPEMLAVLQHALGAIRLVEEQHKCGFDFTPKLLEKVIRLAQGRQP